MSGSPAGEPITAAGSLPTARTSEKAGCPTPAILVDGDDGTRHESGFSAGVRLGLAALVIYLLYQVTKVFLVPLAWAAILTIFFFPIHRRVIGRVESAGGAALISLVLMTILLVAPMAWLVSAFTMEAVSVVGQFRSEEVLPKVKLWVEEQLANLPFSIGSFDEIVDEAGGRARSLVASYSARFAGNVIGFLLDLVVMLMAMFYLFRDGHKIVQMLKDISPLGGAYSERMRGEGKRTNLGDVVERFCRGCRAGFRRRTGFLGSRDALADLLGRNYRFLGILAGGRAVAGLDSGRDWNLRERRGRPGPSP